MVSRAYGSRSSIPGGDGDQVLLLHAAQRGARGPHLLQQALQRRLALGFDGR